MYWATSGLAVTETVPSGTSDAGSPPHATAISTHKETSDNWVILIHVHTFGKAFLRLSWCIRGSSLGKFCRFDWTSSLQFRSTSRP